MFFLGFASVLPHYWGRKFSEVFYLIPHDLWGLLLWLMVTVTVIGLVWTSGIVLSNPFRWFFFWYWVFFTYMHWSILSWRLSGRGSPLCISRVLSACAAVSFSVLLLANSSYFALGFPVLSAELREITGLHLSYFSLMWPENSVHAVVRGNCKAYLICLLSFRDPSASLSWCPMTWK